MKTSNRLLVGLGIITLTTVVSFGFYTKKHIIPNRYSRPIERIGAFTSYTLQFDYKYLWTNAPAVRVTSDENGQIVRKGYHNIFELLDIRVEKDTLFVEWKPEFKNYHLGTPESEEKPLLEINIDGSFLQGIIAIDGAEIESDYILGENVHRGKLLITPEILEQKAINTQRFDLEIVGDARVSLLLETEELNVSTTKSKAYIYRAFDLNLHGNTDFLNVHHESGYIKAFDLAAKQVDVTSIFTNDHVNAGGIEVQANESLNVLLDSWAYVQYIGNAEVTKVEKSLDEWWIGIIMEIKRYCFIKNCQIHNFLCQT